MHKIIGSRHIFKIFGALDSNLIVLIILFWLCMFNLLIFCKYLFYMYILLSNIGLGMVLHLYLSIFIVKISKINFNIPLKYVLKNFLNCDIK